jgi:hypothetical protein
LRASARLGYSCDVRRPQRPQLRRETTSPLRRTRRPHTAYASTMFERLRSIESIGTSYANRTYTYRRPCAALTGSRAPLPHHSQSGRVARFSRVSCRSHGFPLKHERHTTCPLPVHAEHERARSTSAPPSQSGHGTSSVPEHAGQGSSGGLVRSKTYSRSPRKEATPSVRSATNSAP